MGKLLNNLVNIFRDGKNQVADKLTDPIRNGRLAIEDAEAQINSLAAKVAEIGKNTNLTNTKLADAKKDVDKFDRIATAAAKAGNMEDVKQAVQAKKNAEALVATYTDVVKKNEATKQVLVDQISSLEVKKEAGRSNLARLEASLASDKLREESAKADVLGQSQTTFNSLDELQTAADGAKASADAWEATRDSLHPAQKLEEKYDVSGSPVDDEVAKYMDAAKK